MPAACQWRMDVMIPSLERAVLTSAGLVISVSCEGKKVDIIENTSIQRTYSCTRKPVPCQIHSEYINNASCTRPGISHSLILKLGFLIIHGEQVLSIYMKVLSASCSL